MSIPNSEELLKSARKGIRLGTKDRRTCITYLTATKPELTNASLADLFQVSERQIRDDKTRNRRQRADIIKNEDPGLVIADIATCYDKQIVDMEASKSQCKMGSLTYLAHCKAIFNAQLLKVKALQDLGYYPKNLGNMVIEKFEFTSTVASDTQLKARKVNMNFDDEDGQAVEATYSVVKSPQQLETADDADDSFRTVESSPFDEEFPS
jgi:hypothetical protein